MTLLGLVCLLLSSGCGSSDIQVADGWSANVDTLDSGEIVIQNTGAPIWESEKSWQVIEEMRYGNDSGEDTTFLGNIRSFDVDLQGNVYILDGQTQEIYIYDPSGSLMRIVGGEGEGPEEFTGASAVDVSSNGEIWVVEMQKGQITILDSDGNYQEMHRVNSAGWSLFPYPGGFDRVGRYNAVIYGEEGSPELFARFDESFTAIDTIKIPDDSVEGEFFEFVRDDGASMRVAIAFQPYLDWQFSPGGNLWTLFTGTYELTEMTAEGKILRRVTQEFEPIPVTREELEKTHEAYKWFTDQGGQIDISRFPRVKPVVTSFFVDDEGNLWVNRAENENHLFDVFTSEGYFLGQVIFPFSLRSSQPIFRNGLLYGMTVDELGAEVIVRARIESP